MKQVSKTMNEFPSGFENINEERRVQSERDVEHELENPMSPIFG